MVNKLNGNLKYLIAVGTLIALIVGGTFGVRQIAGLEVSAHNLSIEAHKIQIDKLESRISKLEEITGEIKTWQDITYPAMVNGAVDRINQNNRDMVEQILSGRRKP